MKKILLGLTLLSFYSFSYSQEYYEIGGKKLKLDTTYLTSDQLRDVRKNLKYAEKLEKLSYQKIASLSLYAGSIGTVGVDCLFNLNQLTLGQTENNIWLGLGWSINMSKTGVGKDYSKTIGPNAFPHDIYEINKAKNAGVYLIVGTNNNNKLSGGLKIGLGQEANYCNAYDRHQILSPNGYYYTIGESSSIFIIGGYINYYATKNMGIYSGYDTFNGAKLGLFWCY